ncbi:hypothetical protein J1614_001570 [Plenodomus biglobosus]|nr:hypothetical protein J1614_001570 [Plenodomus biglobosus]
MPESSSNPTGSGRVPSRPGQTPATHLAVERLRLASSLLADTNRPGPSTSDFLQLTSLLQAAGREVEAATSVQPNDPALSPSSFLARTLIKAEEDSIADEKLIQHWHERVGQDWTPQIPRVQPFSAANPITTDRLLSVVDEPWRAQISSQLGYVSNPVNVAAYEARLEARVQEGVDRALGEFEELRAKRAHEHSDNNNSNAHDNEQPHHEITLEADSASQGAAAVFQPGPDAEPIEWIVSTLENGGSSLRDFNDLPEALRQAIMAKFNDDYCTRSIAYDSNASNRRHETYLATVRLANRAKVERQRRCINLRSYQPGRTDEAEGPVCCKKCHKVGRLCVRMTLCEDGEYKLCLYPHAAPGQAPVGSWDEAAYWGITL